MKKTILYSLGAVLLLVIAVAVGWHYYCQSLYNAYKSESTATAHHVAGDSLSTNSIASFSEQEISMYGKWEENNKDLNYTVFTLDDAEDGFYWGKEWCEADNVFESDLENHGNGWFKWKVKKNKLLLIHTSNFGFVMPTEYTIVQLEDTVMGMQSQFRRSPKSYIRKYN